MVKSLNSIRQEDAIKAFIRLSGIERKGKGSHRVVNLNNYNLSIPGGVLKVGLLRHLIKLSGYSVEDFLNNV